jgi:hypothetical protein
MKPNKEERKMGLVLRNPEHTREDPTTPTADDRTLRDQLETVATDVKTLGRMARDDARRKIAVARDQGARVYDRALSSGRQAVERRPLTSLGVAAGLGAVACLLWTKGSWR